MSKTKKNGPNYSLGEKIIMFFSLLYTKIFWPRARLIRIPHRIRGKKNIKYGYGFTVGYFARIESSGKKLKKPKITIGNNVVIGDYAHIVGNSNLTIGDNVLIASRVFISDTSHGTYSGINSSHPVSHPNERELFYKNVRIGNDVWIGENVCILPGVEIGNGSIVGAGSIVTKDIPENCICAGNPAKIIKQFINREWEVLDKK